MSADKVILRNDVSGLGKRGDNDEVSKGYVRNFLEPRGLALAGHARGQAAGRGLMRRSRDIMMRASATRPSRSPRCWSRRPYEIAVRASEAGDCSARSPRPRSSKQSAEHDRDRAGPQGPSARRAHRDDGQPHECPAPRRSAVPITIEINLDRGAEVTITRRRLRADGGVAPGTRGAVTSVSPPVPVAALGGRGCAGVGAGVETGCGSTVPSSSPARRRGSPGNSQGCGSSDPQPRTRMYDVRHRSWRPQPPLTSAWSQTQTIASAPRRRSGRRRTASMPRSRCSGRCC